MNPGIDVPSVAAGALAGAGGGTISSSRFQESARASHSRWPGLERGIVPQRALWGRRQTKLRGQLPEAARDARELVRDSVRPA